MASSIFIWPGLFSASGSSVTFTGGVTASSLTLTAGPIVLPVGQFTLSWASGGFFAPVSDGHFDIQNSGGTVGSQFKVDALPTVASGFGTSPSITAGSTPLAGSVNVGTGGVATSGVINFNGTAFPSAPFAVVTATAGTGVEICTGTTTQLTITTSVAWPASTIVSWICISAK